MTLKKLTPCPPASFLSSQTYPSLNLLPFSQPATHPPSTFLIASPLSQVEGRSLFHTVVPYLNGSSRTPAIVTNKSQPTGDQRRS